MKKIEVDIKFKNKEIEDELVAIELEKHIKEKFNNLIGKELDNLDGDILVQVVDNRIMKIKNKQYKVKVEKIIIAQNIKFCIQVEKVQSD
ncbi:hypothetical protein JQ032_06325 [Clostridium botulinum]|nr:hypothetical protein [Clostridium botulinum]